MKHQEAENNLPSFKKGCRTIKPPKFLSGVSAIENPNTVFANQDLMGDKFLMGEGARGDYSTAFVNDPNATEYTHKVRRWQPVTTELRPEIGKGRIHKNFSENEWQAEYRTNPNTGAQEHRLIPINQEQGGGFLSKVAPVQLNAKFMKYGTKKLQPKKYYTGEQTVTPGYAGGDMYVAQNTVPGAEAYASNMGGLGAAGANVGGVFGPEGALIGTGIGLGAGGYKTMRDRENARRALAAQTAHNKAVFTNTYDTAQFQKQSLAGGAIASKYGMKKFNPIKYQGGGTVNPASIGTAVGGLAAMGNAFGDEDEAPWLNMIAALAPAIGSAVGGVGGGGAAQGASAGVPMKYGAQGLNPTQTYKVDGVDSAAAEIEDGEDVYMQKPDGTFEAINVQARKIQHLIDKGNGEFATNPDIKAPTGKKAKALGKRHHEIDPVTGKTGVQTILPIGASVFTRKDSEEARDAYNRKDWAKMQDIWSRTPSMEKSMEKWNKENPVKAEDGMKDFTPIYTYSNLDNTTLTPEQLRTIENIYATRPEANMVAAGGATSNQKYDKGLADAFQAQGITPEMLFGKGGYYETAGYDVGV
jgi:hypothetical protein